MSKVSNKMISSLLALIMVFSVIAMPALGDEGEVTENVVEPTPIAYVWDFDNSSINTEHANYADGTIDKLPFVSDTADARDLIVNGGNEDIAYFTAGNASYSGKGSITIVKEGDDENGKVLRLISKAGEGATYVALRFNNAITGVVNVEFEARISKIDKDGEVISLKNQANGIIYSTNSYVTDGAGKPYIYLSQTKDGNAVAVNPSTNNSRCEHCFRFDGTNRRGENIIASNAIDGNLHKYKMQLDYTKTVGDYAFTYVYKDGTDNLIDWCDASNTPSDADHNTAFSADGTGLQKIYFRLPALESLDALGTDEVAYVYDIDNIRITPEPSAPAANIADGEKGVDIHTKLMVDFNANITDADAKKVELYDASDKKIDTVNTADGTKANIAPTAPLDPQSKYTLVVPKVKFESFGKVFNEQKIEFYTAKDYSLGAISFDDNLDGESKVESAFVSAFSNKVIPSVESAGTYGVTGVKNGVLYLDNSIPNNGTKTSVINLELAEHADEIFHAEFVMDIKSSSYKTGSGWYPVQILGTTGTSGTIRIYENGMYFYVRSPQKSWNDASHKLYGSNNFVGRKKYIVDINIATGVGTCTVVNPDTGVVEKTVTSTTSTEITPIRIAQFQTTATNVIYTDTREVEGTTHYINRVEYDDILLADMPLASAKITSGTASVPVNRAPEIEFNYPVANTSELKLYVDGDAEDTEVETAVFTLSPDGYTVTVDAELEEDTTYYVALDGTQSLNGYTFSGNIGFITAPKEPAITISGVKLYAADDADKTELTALIAGEEVTAELTFANTEDKVQFDTIVYAGVYGTTEDGGVKLLTAAAAEENVAANATKTITVTFTVPEGAEYVKVFAWDKFLTPYDEETKFPNN